MLSTEAILKFILGVAATGVLIFLAVALIDGARQEEESAKSYFGTFVSEIEKADKGNVGEFVMWQDSKDKGRQDVFLVYFGDQFKAKVGDMDFVTYGNENIVCVCFWDGEYGNCPQDNCLDLAYPVVDDWDDRDNGQWFIGNGDGVTIERDGEQYLVKRIYGASWSQVVKDDVLIYNDGVRYIVYSLELDGNKVDLVLHEVDNANNIRTVSAGLSDPISAEGYNRRE